MTKYKADGQNRMQHSRCFRNIKSEKKNLQIKYNADSKHQRQTNSVQGGQTTYKADKQRKRRKNSVQGGQTAYKADKQRTRRTNSVQGGQTTYKADKFLFFFYVKLYQSSPCHQLVMFNFFLCSSNILYSFFVWPHFFLLALSRTFN